MIRLQNNESSFQIKQDLYSETLLKGLPKDGFQSRIQKWRRDFSSFPFERESAKTGLPRSPESREKACLPQAPHLVASALSLPKSAVTLCAGHDQLPTYVRVC